MASNSAVEPRSAAPDGDSIRAADIISALSFALDLTEGQAAGHSARSCVLGMRIAREIGLPVEMRSDLYYALLLKDAGCSSNASRLFHLLASDEISAKRDVKTTDWTSVGWESLQYALRHIAPGAPFLTRVRRLLHLVAGQRTQSRELVKIRCERGASIARRIGLPERTAQAIHSLDEQWNGRGYPDGLRRDSIPILARVMSLAQTLDVFFTAKGRDAAIDVARARSARWFDPDMVKAAVSLARTGDLWDELDSSNLLRLASELEPEEKTLRIGPATLDDICLAFAEVIDAKTPFTYRHSTGVANAATTIASRIGLSDPEITFIRRAALLHDIGKLGVPNTILEKPGSLSDEEWDVVRRHPLNTWEILRRVPGFDELSEVAAEHHEKLDGSGYFRGLSGAQLPTPARILAVADVYDALAAARPYRDALPPERVFAILDQESGRTLDPGCVEALKAAGNGVSASLAALSRVLGYTDHAGHTEEIATTPQPPSNQK